MSSDNPSTPHIYDILKALIEATEGFVTSSTERELPRKEGSRKHPCEIEGEMARMAAVFLHQHAELEKARKRLAPHPVLDYNVVVAINALHQRIDGCIRRWA